MSELATVDHSGTLAIDADQSYWNDRQLAALRHMGVEHAEDGDLTVFHHVCTRTGLDPFARQIYMIGRQSSENVDGQWVKRTKYTIQTGIDGFRLIGRRAANKAHQSISLAAPEWAHEDGSWRPVWRGAWGSPVAARITIHRDGEPFTAVALFDEYKQTKRDGNLTQMWQQRPAGQIAKCAEALAWRMAFPQDLSGIYADEEMGAADNEPARPQGGLGAVLHVEQVEPDRPMESLLLNTSSALAKRMYATFNDAGITERDDRLKYVSDVVGREVSSSSEMTEADASAVIDALAADLEQPFGGDAS